MLTSFPTVRVTLSPVHDHALQFLSPLVPLLIHLLIPLTSLTEHVLTQQKSTALPQDQMIARAEQGQILRVTFS